MKKKIFTMLLAVTMSINLVACGSADEATEASSDPATETIVEGTSSETEESSVEDTTESAEEAQADGQSLHMIFFPLLQHFPWSVL